MPAQQPAMGMNQQVQGMPVQQPATGMNQQVQGMSAQQPAMGMNQQVQGMSPQQPQPSEKKSKSGMFIIIVLLLLVVIGGLVYYLFFGNKNTDSNINTNDNQSSSTVSSNTGTNDKTLTINGYTVTVPSDLKYETANNNGIEYLNVVDSSGSMLATITVGPDNYDAYKSDYSSIQQSLQSNGYVSTYAVVNYGGREFLTFRFFYSDKSIYSNYFLTKVSDTLIAAGYLYEGRNFSASNAYGYIDKIVDSVGGNGSSSNFSINDFKFDGDSNSFLQDIE